MNHPRIDVRHWLVARTVRSYGGSITESDLLGVPFEYAVPRDTVFPSRRGPVVAFLRVTARSAGVVEFLIRVHHEQRSGGWQPVTRFADQGRPLVLPGDRTVVLSESIHLPHVRLEGTGVYAVRIWPTSSSRFPLMSGRLSGLAGPISGGGRGSLSGGSRGDDEAPGGLVVREGPPPARRRRSGETRARWLEYTARLSARDPKTIRQGLQDLEQPDDPADGRVRKGGGRRPQMATRPPLGDNLRHLLQEFTAGEPMREGVLWTRPTPPVGAAAKASERP